MRVVALCAIRRDELHLPGSELDLPDETAEALLQRDPPAVARLTNPRERTAAPPKAGEFNLTDSVKKLVPQIDACESVDLLRALEQAELANEPPRKGVLDAIAARLAEIETPATDDDEDGA